MVKFMAEDNVSCISSFSHLSESWWVDKPESQILLREESFGWSVRLLYVDEDIADGLQKEWKTKGKKINIFIYMCIFFKVMLYGRMSGALLICPQS